MNRKGFSYIEVLMAAALLSVVIAPTVSGFYLAGRNFQYAYDYYRANLEGQSLLEQAQSVLSQEKDFLGYADQSDIFQLVDPDSLSVLDFEYALALYVISEAGQLEPEGIVLESRSGLWSQESNSLSADNPIVFKNERGAAYDRYDTVFVWSGRSVVTRLPGSNPEDEPDWEHKPYVLFEKAKEPFGSYLAVGSVYHKDGRLLKQMVKVLTTS